MEPDFFSIWVDADWLRYRVYATPKHSRKYYKVRSLVRIAFWTPLTILTFWGLLVVVSG